MVVVKVVWLVVGKVDDWAAWWVAVMDASLVVE